MAMRHNARFVEKAQPLTSRYLEILEAEHVREMAEMYQEQLLLQQELARVVELMETEMIPRERMLHDVFEKATTAYVWATQDLGQAVNSMSESVAGVSGSRDSRRRELYDPLRDTEVELRRIKSLLQQQPVRAPPCLPPAVARERRRSAAAQAADLAAWPARTRGPSPGSPHDRGAGASSPSLDERRPGACSAGTSSPSLLDERSPGAGGTPPAARGPPRRPGTIVRSGDSPQEGLSDEVGDTRGGATDGQQWARARRGLAGGGL
ncbi:unnamed protein product [Prorocentrum cordatum]|uniref:V-type proton ATPase subunit a n=1 Tax=Prorocentrum cordatum TaxID=2364126 RepID=A0ABN9R5Y6_9DINO|nr:unnamed protein product [Polarella glacialis]